MIWLVDISSELQILDLGIYITNNDTVTNWGLALAITFPHMPAKLNTVEMGAGRIV